VPVVTPPDDDARLDDQALAAHADGLLTAGAAGTVALATTGEASSLNDDERALVVNVCRPGLRRS
jgi:4-hydroxy-tetrahydrodipicolinate synthase